MNTFNDDNKEDGKKEEIGSEMMGHNEKHGGNHQWEKVFFLIHIFKEKITGEHHKEMSHRQRCSMTGLIYVEGDDCEEQG